MYREIIFGMATCASIELACVGILRDADCEGITNQPRESCEKSVSRQAPSPRAPGKKKFISHKPQEERQVQSIHLALHDIYTTRSLPPPAHTRLLSLPQASIDPAQADGTFSGVATPAEPRSHESRKVFGSLFHDFRHIGL